MIEFLLEIVKLPNLFATVLLGLVLSYWLLMIFGIFGMDLDADLDMDLDADLDADLDGHIDGGIVADVLSFLHIGEVPVMIVASFFALCFWVTTVLSNHYLNPEWSLWVTTYCFIPTLIVSALLTKLIIWPMTPVFRGMKGNETTRVIGSRAVVTTRELDGKNGQVSIYQADDPEIVINAITANNQILKRSQEVLVVRFDEETGVYVVEPVKPENS